MALVRLYVGLDMGIYCVVPRTAGSMSSRMKQLLIGVRLVSCSEEELRPGSDEDSTTEPVASSLSGTGALVLLSYSVDGFLNNFLPQLVDWYYSGGQVTMMVRRIPPPSKM